MDPAKPEGVSRQSSILKPTKLRQPLQCVAPASGSSESSPTIKIKRRVSFARNKRIREFCNEAEPGTVLDDTYEEHDSSSTKSNSTGGNEPLTITVPCHDKENFPVQLFLQTDQIECKEVPLNTANEDGDNLPQCEMEMDNSLNPDLQNKDIENATVYGDDGMDITTYVPSRIIACHNQDTNFLDKEAIEGITENLPLIPCKNSTAHQNNKTDIFKNDAANSTDLTVAISQLLGAGHAHKQLSDLNKYPNLSYNNENTAPMEFTSAIPSSTWIRPNSLCHSDKKTENFDNLTMEFTTAVPQANIRENENTDKISNLTNRTKFFADKSMEITEAVPIDNIIQASVNVESVVPETVKTVESVPTLQSTRYAVKISNEPLQDQTKIFNNKSIEMTEAIPAYIENCKEIQNKMQHERIQDKTEIFANKSIEMTEAIPVYIENRDEMQNKIPPEKEQNNTKIFYDKSIEMTEAIPIYIENCNQVSKDTSLKVEVDKTKIFDNKSMEMTEAINNCNKKDNIKETTNIFLDKSMEMTEVVPAYNIMQKPCSTVERTPENTIFADKSMEMTGTIPIFYKFHHSNYGNVPDEFSEDKTNIYANKSMEMTEAIPSYKSTKSQNNIEKTNVFTNVSMEMTEAVPVSNIHQYRETIPDEETNIILNGSMEMTEALPSLKSANQIPVYNTEYEYNSNTNKIQRKSLPNRKSIYNKSSEITESLASLMTKDPAIIRDLYQEQTELFANESMNITETIPVSQSILSDLNNRQGSTDTNLEKTKMFANNSMNVSETAPIEQNISILKHSKIPLVEDKTRFFMNNSMEMTEAISRCPGRMEIELNKSKNLAQEKTKIFLDKSMDMTETIAVLNSFPSTKQGKNSMHEGPHFIGNDKSLILRLSTIPNTNSDADFLKTKENIASSQSNTNAIQIHHDDSMEMTAGVSALKATKIIHNDKNKKTLDQENSRTGNLFEAVSDNKNIINASNKSTTEDKFNISTKLTGHEQPYDSTKIFPNASMEFTALVPAVSNEANLSKKTDLSHNQSILSSRMDPIQNPVNISNFESFRDENFHRITSDELNSLYASMNLPIQKYSAENSSVLNSSIPACSNVSILRESLRKGTLFQPNTHSMQNTSVQTPAKNYVTADGKNSSKPYCDTDFEMGSCKKGAKTTINKTIPMSMDTSEVHGNLSNKFATDQNNSKANILSLSSTGPIVAIQTDKTTEISLKKMPMTEMDIDKTTDVSLKNTQEIQLPSISMDIDETEIDPRSVQQLQPSGSHQVLLAPAVVPVHSIAIPIQEYNKSHCNMDISVAQRCPASTTVSLHNSVKITDQTTKSSCTVKETFITTEDKNIHTHSKYMVNEKPGTVEIYHDVSMEIGAPSTKPSGKRKSDETYETINKRNPALYAATTVCTYTQATESSNENNHVNPNENSLSRLPSDSTEVLLATMGFKTELAYPLIINDKTIIKVSQQPSINKTLAATEGTENCSAENQVEAYQSQVESNITYNVAENDKVQTEIDKDQIETNKTYVIDKINDQVEMENPIGNGSQSNEIPYVGIPIVKSPGNRNPMNVDEDIFDDDKENQEPSVKINLFAEKYSELEEIQPPSFLCSDSMLQDDDLSDIVKLPDDDEPDPAAEKACDDSMIVPFAELESKEHFIINEFPARPVFAEKIESRPEPSILSENIVKMKNRKQELLEELKRLSKNDADSASEKVSHKESRKRKPVEHLTKKDADSQKLLSSKKGSVESVNENVVKEPLSPFMQLIEDIKAFEKRDDCIWSVHTVDSELIAIDFISKSFIFVIRLKEIESIDCIRNIEKIEIISRLSAESKNILLKIVHNLLLSKLNPKEMLDKYKLYEDIMSLLEFVSNEVIFAMKFMFDLEKLNALNLLNINEKRIIFMVASRKANVILKMSLTLKTFKELNPDDIDVVCVLGDVRINDIKQLIVNIKRDYKFLSRYIKDVKDYITLMEESTSLHKF